MRQLLCLMAVLLAVPSLAVKECDIFALVVSSKDPNRKLNPGELLLALRHLKINHSGSVSLDSADLKTDGSPKTRKALEEILQVNLSGAEFFELVDKVFGWDVALFRAGFDTDPSPPTGVYSREEVDRGIDYIMEKEGELNSTALTRDRERFQTLLEEGLPDRDPREVSVSRLISGIATYYKTFAAARAARGKVELADRGLPASTVASVVGAYAANQRKNPSEQVALSLALRDLLIKRSLDPSVAIVDNVVCETLAKALTRKLSRPVAVDEVRAGLRNFTHRLGE